MHHVLRNYRDAKYDDKDYNCLHFVCDAYKDLTNQDLSIFVNDLMTSQDKRTINPAKLSSLKKLAEPVNPCLAVMHGAEPHAGIFVDGFILHLNHNGVGILPPHLAQLQFGLITYYAIT